MTMYRRTNSFQLGFALLLASLAGCGQSEPEAWKKVVNSKDSEQAFRMYLKEFPSGAHADRAYGLLESLMFEKTIKEGKAESYSVFLKEFPHGFHSGEVRARLRSAKEKEAKANGTPESLAGYVQEFHERRPLGPYNDGFINVWTDIANLWEKARKEDKLTEFLIRIKDYPDVVMELSPAEHLARACDGKPVFGAPSVRGPGPHQIVLLTEKGMIHAWNKQLPASWLMEKPENVPLVLVVGMITKPLLGVQQYEIVDKYEIPWAPSHREAPPITMFGFNFNVRLVEAKTGKTLATNYFQKFPAAPRTAPLELIRIDASFSQTELDDWLRPWIMKEAPAD